MIELETPQPQPQPAPDPRIEEVHGEGNLSHFEVSPLQEGYGVTLGNALRRVLLSSLEGAAVTSIQINGVFHEFSTIENVKEDVTQIVLNMKKLRLRSFARHALTLKLVKRGAGPVTAGDIAESADVEIVNPDLVLLDARLRLRVDRDGPHRRDRDGLSARRAHRGDADRRHPGRRASSRPVRRVNYQVEKTRVGQMTNYDKLIARDRDRRHDDRAGGAQPGGRHPRPRVRPLRGDRPPGDRGRGRGARSRRAANLLDAPIEELDLPMRAYNSLKRNSITKIGQVLSLSDDEFLRMRNFGQKSLDELKERLALRGFISPEASVDEHRRVGPAGFGGARRGGRGRARPGGLDRCRIGSPAASSAGPHAHRVAMLGNLAVSVLRYERVKTTEAKAKEVRGIVDGHDHPRQAWRPPRATAAGEQDAARAAHRREADGRDRDEVRRPLVAASRAS